MKLIVAKQANEFVIIQILTLTVSTEIFLMIIEIFGFESDMLNVTGYCHILRLIVKRLRC